MSIFDSIKFNEYSLLEGQQADEYKARKAKEAADRTRKEIKQANDRTFRKNAAELATKKFSSPEEQQDAAMKNVYRAASSSKTARNDLDNVNVQGDIPKDVKEKAIKSGISLVHAANAIDRHDRKMAKRNKAKHESVMAMIEAYECEYNY